MMTRSAGYLLAAAFVVAMAAALLPVADGYGEKEFLAAYVNPNISHHEVRDDVFLSASLPERTRPIALVGVKKPNGKLPAIDGGSKHRGIRYHPLEDTDKIVLKDLEFRNLVAPSSAEDGGGALYAAMAKALIDHCVFRNNKAESAGGGGNGDGGAVEFFSVDFEITHSFFEGNRAGGYGGAIYGRSESPGAVRHSQFKNNQAGERGGAIVRRHGGLTVDTCTFEGNTAEGEEGGGGLSCSEASCVIANTHFKRNVAKKGPGGGLRIYVDDEGLPYVCKGNTFSANKAAERKSDNVYVLSFPETNTTGAVRFCDPKPPPLTLINATSDTVVYGSCAKC